MTKKDFVAIATEISRLISKQERLAAAAAVAAAAAKLNPRFDSKRFFAACGV